MCEQCLANAIEIMEEFLPGWCLVMATTDGHAMMKGDYGLVRCNDPDFVIPIDLKPIPDPAFDFSDEQINVMSKEEFQKVEAFTDLVAGISGMLITDPVTGYELVSACKEAGWDPKIHGWRIEYWLTHQMGKAIAEFEGRPEKPIAEQTVAQQEEYHGFDDQAHKDAFDIQILYDIHQFVRCRKCDTPCDPDGCCWECGCDVNEPNANQRALTNKERLTLLYIMQEMAKNEREDLPGILLKLNAGMMSQDEVCILAAKLQGHI